MFCFVAEEINFLVSSAGVFCLEACFSTFCFAGFVYGCVVAVPGCALVPWSFAGTALPVASQRS